MNPAVAPTTQGIKKLYVKETVLFAINNIPQVDATTLKQFLDLVNANGTFGLMTTEEILVKMRLLLTYVPGASELSLQIVADLLGLSLDSRRVL